jgi:hypothetical protein
MRRVVLGLLGAALLGCSDGVAPTADLSGTWVASQVEASTTITLVQSGTAISGSGSHWQMAKPSSGTFTVSGSYARPDVTLTFHHTDGTTSQYTGVVQSDSAIAGRELLPGNVTDSLAFKRQ